MKNRTRKRPVQIYLSEDEYAILTEKTKLAGAQSISSFIRQFIIYGLVYDVDYSYLREYNTALSRIGNNLNQIAHKANTNDNADNYDLKQAKELMEKIWHTQKSMLSKQPLKKQ